MSAPVKKVAALRSSFRRSQTEATHASKSEIAEVAAAKSTSTKKVSPSHGPVAPSVANTFGRVMNMSPGPAFIASFTGVPVFTANMYTTGMIIRPATTAMKVSNISMRRTHRSMESVFFMYEPYVIMMPIARERE